MEDILNYIKKEIDWRRGKERLERLNNIPIDIDARSMTPTIVSPDGDMSERPECVTYETCRAPAPTLSERGSEPFEPERRKYTRRRVRARIHIHLPRLFLCVCMSICLSVCLYVCLSVSPLQQFFEVFSLDVAINPRTNVEDTIINQ